MHPPWVFAAPVRRSRFTSLSPKLARYNVEVCLADIATWAFDRRSEKSVVWYDLQTSIEGTWPVRLGAGRAGFFEGRYLKGLGRTPAAVNWNDPADRYHGSGHLSASSAAGERLVSALARRLGVARSIVPCEGLLAADLSAKERRSITPGSTSADPRAFGADGLVMAISVKPGGFARMSNVVFAFDHLPTSPREVARVLLAFEHGLGVRHPTGNPRDLAQAMGAAFERGLSSFESFTRVGLVWLFLQNNFTLDGRFVDLELPFPIGVPFVGRGIRRRSGSAGGGGVREARFHLGFETLQYVIAWRGFIRYLLGRLTLLDSPIFVADTVVRTFLRRVREAIARHFPPAHLVHDNASLLARVGAARVDWLGLEGRDRQRLVAMTRDAWRDLGGGGAPSTALPTYAGVRPPLPMRILAPPFVPPPSPVAHAFADAVAQTSRAENAKQFLTSVEREATALARSRWTIRT